jgi:hypothetical protein
MKSLVGKLLDFDVRSQNRKYEGRKDLELGRMKNKYIQF